MGGLGSAHSTKGTKKKKSLMSIAWLRCVHNFQHRGKGAFFVMRKLSGSRRWQEGIESMGPTR